MKNDSLLLDRLKNVSILCVEDDGLIARMYKKGLGLADAHVVVASDGDQALRLLESQSIDIILLDLEMPNLNGFDLLKRIRESAQFCNMPVIVLSNASVIDEVDTTAWFESMSVARVLLKCNISLASLTNHIQDLVNKTVTSRADKL